ncbi:MAG TPA: YbhN family protein [Longimicrobium sp.]|nr:YbhN family protein [Longimicrobium sp.]
MTQPSIDSQPTEPAASASAAGSARAVDGELAREAVELAHLEERPRRIPWLRWALMVVFLALAVRLVVPQLGPLQNSVDTLRNMVPAYLVAAALAQIGSYACSGLMLRHIVALTGDRLSAGRATAISVASGSVGLVAGGAIGMAGSTFRWLRDAGVSPEGALLASWLPTVLNAAVMVVLGVTGVVELVAAHGLSGAEWAAVGLALAITLGTGAFLWWAAGHPGPGERLALSVSRRWARLRRKPPRDAAARERVRATYEALALLKERGWVRPAIDSALMILLDALTLWLVFVAMLDVVSPHVFFAGYAIPLMVAKVGVVPGGVGLVEGMMVGIFRHVGEETATAALAVVGYRLFAFWLPNLIGFGVLPFLQARKPRASANT